MQKITISQVIDDLEKPAKPGEDYYTVDPESSKLVYALCLDVLNLLTGVKEFIEVIRVKWTAPTEMRVAPYDGAHLYAHVTVIVQTGFHKFEVETKIEVAYDFGGPRHLELDKEAHELASKVLEQIDISVRTTTQLVAAVREIVEKDVANFSKEVPAEPEET